MLAARPARRVVRGVPRLGDVRAELLRRLESLEAHAARGLRRGSARRGRGGDPRVDVLPARIRERARRGTRRGLRHRVCAERKSARRFEAGRRRRSNSAQGPRMLARRFTCPSEKNAREVEIDGVLEREKEYRQARQPPQDRALPSAMPCCLCPGWTRHPAFMVVLILAVGVALAALLRALGVIPGSGVPSANAAPAALAAPCASPPSTPSRGSSPRGPDAVRVVGAVAAPNVQLRRQRRRRRRHRHEDSERVHRRRLLRRSLRRPTSTVERRRRDDAPGLRNNRRSGRRGGRLRPRARVGGPRRRRNPPGGGGRRRRRRRRGSRRGSRRDGDTRRRRRIRRRWSPRGEVTPKDAPNRTDATTSDDRTNRARASASQMIKPPPIHHRAHSPVSPS